uniref:sensor histidine kinase n=1 Tax=Eisenbergiella sp. TaxID=1924109 RepID=UPI003AB18137
MRTLDLFFRYIRDMKLKTKLICIYIIASFSALFLLLIVLKAALGKQLFSHEQSMLSNALNQSISQLDAQINDTINLSNVIYNNDDIISAINVDYGKDYFKMYTAYSNIIKPELYIYKCLIPEVTDILLYSSCGIFPHKNLVNSLSDLETEPWFPEIKDIHTPSWIVTGTKESPSLASIRMLPKIPSYPFDNYLYLETDYKNFFACTNSISQDAYGLVIAGKNNSLIYQYHSFPGDDFPVNAQELLTDYEKTVEEYGSRYIFLSAPVESAGWTIYYYSPISNVKGTVERTIFTSFFLIALCFTILFLLTFFTVNSILSPLRQLTGVISKISLADIEKHELLIIPNRNDEIGKLIHTFNSMLKRIRSLIDEAYVQKLKAKEYQLNALRAQINPHFLYNTLSLISARAIIAEQTEISETVQLLTLFYRTSLNKGQDTTTIRNELENIKTYISIQLILTSHSFLVEYQLEETLLELPIPCLILQPIVENAIEHGLRSSRRQPRRLIIALSEEKGICFIRVCDNGCGIPPDKMQGLFACETTHIGIKNVNERLKLSYGDNLGLIINSEADNGTEVIIRIPLQKNSPKP